MKSGPIEVSERTSMRKDSLLTTAISDYRMSLENVFSPPVQHNVALNDSSRITVKVSFRDVTGMKPCPDLSTNQLELRIARGTVKGLSSVSRIRLH
ncbi:hypothetical protein TNCV_4747481 [Trichonephila clavipes]|nr:hypothetical protein TNCV_4747481 [Trichonephila clavipes]